MPQKYEDVLPRQELFLRMNRFLADKNRGISVQRFADACGLSKPLLYEIFRTKKIALSINSQIRISKALAAYERGEIAVVQHKDLSTETVRRKTPKPVMVRSMALTMKDGKIGLRVGVRNRHDYSIPTFEEEVKGE